MINDTNVQKAGIIGVDYKAYIEYLRNRGYDREHISIDETYTDIITRLSIEKGTIGTVIDVRCPPGYKMTVVGSYQLAEECSEIAGFLMVRLANTENTEIDPDIRIKIIKEKVSCTITLIDSMFYKDISATEYTKIPTNETKSFGEQYAFDKGIEINGGEHLKIEAVHPNIYIDANNIRFSLGLDLWERYR